MAANGIRTLPLFSRKSVWALGDGYTSIEIPRWFSTCRVMFTLESVSGAPSAMSITPSFQAWHSIAGDSEYERIVGSSFTPPWFDINAASNPSVFPDGDFTPITNVAPGASGVSQMKTIMGGFPWRLKLKFTMTGGTSPIAQVSAMVFAAEDIVPVPPRPLPGL